MRNIWCWLEIPSARFDGLQSPINTAVLYFSASHGAAAPKDRQPIFLHAPSGDPGTIEKTLATATSARSFAFCGRAITSEYMRQDWKILRPLWDAVRTEYHTLHHGATPEFNLQLGADGRIRTHLDPFRKAAYVHNRDLLTAFRDMNGEIPAALVVQQASRAALKHAMHCGAWRVQPELVKAVDDAIAAYEAVRAPFYCPNEIQSLGWLDEESMIQCNATGIPGFREGQLYALRTWIEDTAWTGSKVNLMGVKEKLELTGRELVIELTADAGKLHHFHVRRPKPNAAAAALARRKAIASELEAPDDEDDTLADDIPPNKDDQGVTHHHVTSLTRHFKIPVPRDVAQTNPTAYQANLARLERLEELINA